MDKTFTITLKLTDSVNKHEIFPEKTYRNSIVVVQEIKKLLDEGIFSSKAELARNIGVSRVHVTQMLNLLKIDQELLEYIINLGDPLPSSIVTERKLRSVIDHPREQKSGKNSIIFKQM